MAEGTKQERARPRVDRQVIGAVETTPTEIDNEILAPRFFRVLGDPTRVRALRLLLEAPAGECSVGDLVEALNAPQSRVSTHLSCLRWCGLVQTRRVGKQVFYRITDPRVRDILALGTALASDNMAGISTCGMLR